MSILFGLTLMFSAPAWAMETMATIVREMLLLEAEQARQNMSSCLRTPQEQEGASQPDVAKIKSSKSTPALKLKAIYGKDTQLLAEVQHEQRLLLFQQGQLWPIGRERDRSMRLLSLSSRCIELEIRQTQAQAAQPQPQPQPQLELQSIKLCLPSGQG
ncbi:hypothetical protein [Alcaligenes nematophilus]|uniref:hypothetical protein n=1 Tax=Alcaligenes nematophilus TaxID=2994643 RepID=UPI003850FBFD